MHPVYAISMLELSDTIGLVGRQPLCVFVVLNCMSPKKQAIEISSALQGV